MDDRRRRFEAQILPHLDAAYNLARWLSRSPVDADDVVQDAMLCAFRAFDGFRGGDARAWLMVIVRNCWASAGRVKRRRVFVDLENSMADGGLDPEEVAIQAGHQRRLESMIAQLPADFREALILREIEEMSYREIAEITETPIGTVMSRLARARTKLRSCVKESV